MPTSLKVEFYLVDAMEIYYFLPLIEALKKEGVSTQLVAVKKLFNSAGNWFNDEEAWKILDRMNVDYVKSPNLNADIAITTQASDILRDYRNLKVRLMYGVSLNKCNFNHSFIGNKGFDAVLAHGEFSKKFVARWLPEERIPIIGYPRYDGFFNMALTKSKAREELGIGATEKIISYLPTWDEWSSVPEYGGTIHKLAQEYGYKIVCKPHHCTARLPEKKDELKCLFNLSNYFFNTSVSTGLIMKAADVIVCDAKSGVAPEALLFNPEANSIALIPSKIQWPEKAFEPELFEYAVVVNQVDLLQKAFINLSNPSEQSINQKLKLREYFYSSTFGKISESSVKAIKTIGTFEKLSDTSNWKKELERKIRPIKNLMASCLS